MQTKPVHLLLFLFTVILLRTTAQEPGIEVIPAQPCTEAYDLLKDSKGYLWIGHDLGISRYDGADFTTLRHPEQNAISMTDLIEDFKGRIWCHNFSGQIFYVENLQLHLLTAYNYKEERFYPRMVICGDELVATSAKGLFVYNLKTAKSRYYPITKGTNSLVKVGNKVICYAYSGWYDYEAGKGVSRLFMNTQLPVNNLILQCQSYKDTFFIVANPGGVYYKMTLQNREVKLQEKVETGAYINTVSIQPDKVWINTKQHSFTTDKKSFIPDMSLSDVLTDEEGNRWMSSLKKGPCVQYKSIFVKKMKDPLFPAGHDIRSLYLGEEKMFWGTSNGIVYEVDSLKSFRPVLAIPKQEGSIERIISLGKDKILVAALLSLYSFDYVTKKATKLPVNISVKDMIFQNETLYIASTWGIKAALTTELDSSNPSVLQEKVELGRKEFRCRSIAFANDSLIAAYNDGVYILHDNIIEPLLYRQKPIYASVVRSVNGKVIIGTFTQGIFMLEGRTLKNLTEEDGLASNLVKNIKIMGGYAWVLFSDHIQQLSLDMRTVSDFPMPFAKGSIMDFLLWENNLLIATNNGIYSVEKPSRPATITSSTFIDKIIANNRDRITGHQLKHYQNYLQFHVSTPYFSSFSKIIYQYRIKNAPDSSWLRAAPEQNVFDLIALEPGAYEFQIVATDIDRNAISRPATYSFTILPAWYQHWLFKVLVALAVLAAGFYLVWNIYRRRLRHQQAGYEKQLAIQLERQRISAEIHDDIGAGLSAVGLLTEIVKNKLPEGESKHEVGKIHTSISELAHKMREVIWSLNTDNDYLENLLYYIRRQALVLFENSQIRLKTSFPADEIPVIAIKGEKRRHIYLAVKEALHNVMKHSAAQNCTLSFCINNDLLHIAIADDGKGFAPANAHPEGSGLTSMKRRLQQIKGTFGVEAKENTTIRFTIPIIEHA